jgi:hypothetical protein
MTVSVDTSLGCKRLEDRRTSHGRAETKKENLEGTLAQESFGRTAALVWIMTANQASSAAK